MSEKKEYTPGGKSKYAHRKARRANGGSPASREQMPWYYLTVTQDFAQRERDQEKVRAAGKKLSANPLRPWGAEPERRLTEQELAIIEMEETQVAAAA
jgi:hypothetical protein